MDNSSKIKDLLRKIAGTDKATYSFRLMEVVSVEGDLCTARLGDFEIPRIRLASIVDGSENGILVTPTPGSIILVADISCGELRNMVAVAYSEIDSIRIHKEDTTIYADDQTVAVEVGESLIQVTDGVINLEVGETQAEMTDGKVTLQVGESQIEITNGLIQCNGGSLGSMIKIADLTTKLNALVGTVNSLVSAYNEHIHVCPQGTTKTTEATAGKAANFKQSDYENTKVTH